VVQEDQRTQYLHQKIQQLSASRNPVRPENHLPMCVMASTQQKGWERTASD